MTMMIGHNLVFVRKLVEAQPLAFRVLKRIKVSCPFKEKHGCSWQGDYGDLQDHLVSKSAHLNNNKRTTTVNDDDVIMQSDSVKNIGDDNDDESECSDDSHDLIEMFPSQAEPSQAENNHERNGVANHDDDDNHRHSRPTMKSTNRTSLAESFKEEANAKFSTRNYTEAKALYKKAISVLDNDTTRTTATTNHNSSNRNSSYHNENERKMAATIHANIAAINIMTREYIKCIENCNIAISLDNSYIKAYMRKSKALVALGRFHDAFMVLKSIVFECKEDADDHEMKKKLEKECRDVQQLNVLFTGGEEQLQNQQYAKAKSTFGQLLTKSNALNVILNAARADLGLGLTDSSLRLSLQVLRTDPTSSDGYEVRGQTMSLMGDFDSAMQLLKEGLRLNPDCQRIKSMLKTNRSVYGHIKDARAAVFQRRFHDAVDSFTLAFDLQCKQSVLPLKAPLYSILLTERAEAHLRLKDYESALQDASKAVYSLDDCVKAWIILSNALHGLGRHEDALSQMEDLMSKWGSNNEQIRRAYEKADFEVRKVKRPDFYALFGVSSLVSEMELKKAYKLKAKELHPDRLSGSNYTDDQRKEGERQFKLLGEGLEILCNDFKRQLYDEGYDQAAIRERVAAAQQAAHRQGSGRNYHHHH